MPSAHVFQHCLPETPCFKNDHIMISNIWFLLPCFCSSCLSPCLGQFLHHFHMANLSLMLESHSRSVLCVSIEHIQRFNRLTETKLGIHICKNNAWGVHGKSKIKDHSGLPSNVLEKNNFHDSHRGVLTSTV